MGIDGVAEVADQGVGPEINTPSEETRERAEMRKTGNLLIHYVSISQVLFHLNL